jgi:putative transposase
MLKTYKYRLYPTASQKVLMEKHFGACRYIYNYGLSEKIRSYQETGKGRSRFDIQSDLPTMKKEKEWLKEINAQSLQHSLESLDKAFTNFFKDKKGFPNFKSKGKNRKSFSCPQHTNVDFLKGIVSIRKFRDGIRCIFSRTFEGKIKTSTVTKTPTDKYFISILVETDVMEPELKPIDESQAIGIDLGIKTFAVLSNGEEIQNPKFLRKSLLKLKRDQRKMSRKVKGSNNRNKQRIKVARTYEKVTNKRNDFLNKLTTKLVSEHNTICLEDLNVKGMIKNHKLAQALSDVSIGTFNRMIEYKAKERGVNIIRIGRFEPSSKMCTCGTVNTKLKLSDRIWTCDNCNVTHDRDLLAANNIKRFAFLKNNTAGIAGINACGDESLDSPMKQEGN